MPAIDLRELLKREIADIQESEKNASRSSDFARYRDREDKTVKPWDVPDKEMWIDGIRPPTFSDFVEKKEFMDGELFPRQRNAIEASVGNDPRNVFYPRMDLDEYRSLVKNGNEPIDNIVDTVVLLWGKGSGKDFLIAYLIAWLVYVVNSMQDPYAYFTHEYGEPFEAINVAHTSDQARDVFFNKLANNLHRKCFERFPFEERAEEIVFLRNLAGYNEPVDFLRLYSRHSKSASYEGHGLIFFIMDEASSFELRGTQTAQRNMRTSATGEEYVFSLADEIYNTLKSSANTRFGSQWLGFIISFPRVENDFTMRKYKESLDRERSPFLWGDKGTTWDINPRTRREHFQRDYEEDEEEAKLKYECEPPPVRGGFFTVTELIDNAFHMEFEPAITYHETITESFDGQKHIALSVDPFRLSPKYTYYAHFDPGLSGDSFAFALAHPNWLITEQMTDIDGLEFSIPQTVIDAILVWKPDKRNKITVDFLNVNETIMNIAKKCKLAYCTADVWNSETLKQQLQRARVRVDYEGTQNREQVYAYKNMKMLMYRGLLRICGTWEDPRYPQLAIARQELRRVQLINGSKIDHPPGGSKDIADAIAGAVLLASQRGYGDTAFADWNQQKQEDVLLLSNEKIMKREKSIIAAPTAKQMMQAVRGMNNIWHHHG